MPIGVKFLAEATLDKRGAYRKSQKATWVGKLIGYAAYNQRASLQNVS